jgi:hypothetical protein
MKKEEALAAVDASRAVEGQIPFKALATLEGFFRCLGRFPTPDSLIETDPFYEGLRYGACQLVLYHQEAVYGNKMSSMRRLLQNRATGRTRLEAAVKAVFLRNEACGERLLSAAETLLRLNVRELAKLDTPHARDIKLILDALTKKCLSSTGALLESQLRTVTSEVEVAIPGTKRTRKVKKISIKKPLISIAGMPLRGDEAILLRAANTALNGVPSIVTPLIAGMKVTNIAPLEAKLVRVVETCYGFCDNANRILHHRRRLIRDEIIRTRRSAPAADQKSIDSKISAAEWAATEARIITDEGSHHALLEALAIAFSCEPTVDSLNRSFEHGLERKLVPIFVPSADASAAGASSH